MTGGSHRDDPWAEAIRAADGGGGGGGGGAKAKRRGGRSLGQHEEPGAERELRSR